MVCLKVYEPVTAIPPYPQYAQTKHTHECLSQRLQELASALYHCLPAERRGLRIGWRQMPG